MYRFYNYFRTTVNQSDIVYKKKTKEEKLISALYNSECLCCLTSNSDLIGMNTSTKEITIQISCNHLISFIKKDIILIISSSNHVLQIWNCIENDLLSEYDFGEDIIEDYFINKTILKVTLKSNQKISYFSINDNCQLELTRTIHRDKNNDYQHCVLLDLYVEFFYSFDNSKTLLVVYHDTNPTEIYNDIDFHSLPKYVIYLSNSNSIAWLTQTSIIIFNPLYKDNIFQTFSLTLTTDTIEYDLVHDNYNSVAFSGGLGNLLGNPLPSTTVLEGVGRC